MKRPTKNRTMRVLFMLSLPSNLIGCAQLDAPYDLQESSHAQPVAAPQSPRTDRRTNEALERMRARLSRSSSNVSMQRRPDGTLKLDLGGGFENASVVQMDDAGQRSRTCIDQPGAVEAVFGVAR